MTEHKDGVIIVTNITSKIYFLIPHLGRLDRIELWKWKCSEKSNLGKSLVGKSLVSKSLVGESFVGNVQKGVSRVNSFLVNPLLGMFRKEYPE